jgi:exopolyphosphatase/guanosine-5'-triphosphate,3'-diphosphate pyrophosphatase
MREGVLYDLMGRFTSGDARERTVGSMQKRYQVDLAQAARVEKTAVEMLRQVGKTWQFKDPLAEQALRWATRLHEIGLDVAHSGYHRHGAYLLENADMPGFSREEQKLLAWLVRSHRRKLVLDGLEDLIPPWDRLAIRLLLILRLSVLLHRNRTDDGPPPFRVSPRGRGLQIRFRLRSLRNHPLTSADLQQEAEYLRAEGMTLRIMTAR